MLTLGINQSSVVRAAPFPPPHKDKAVSHSQGQLPVRVAAACQCSWHLQQLGVGYVGLVEGMWMNIEYPLYIPSSLRYCEMSNCF